MTRATAAEPHSAYGAFVCNVFDKHRPLVEITEKHHSSNRPRITKATDEQK